MQTEITEGIENNLWDEVLSTGESFMTEDLARWLLKLHFTDAQQQRAQILAERGNAGTLTEKERLEVEQYRRVGNLLSLIKSKARLFLKRAGKVA